MARHIGSPDWIDAYLEWTDREPGIGDRFLAYCGDDDGEDVATVYLEWIDAAPAVAQVAAQVANTEPGMPDLLRQTVLLMALRTESECVHLLRQALDSGEPTARTLRLAVETLEHVDADVQALSSRFLEMRAH